MWGFIFYRVFIGMSVTPESVKKIIKVLNTDVFEGLIKDMKVETEDLGPYGDVGVKIYLHYVLDMVYYTSLVKEKGLSDAYQEIQDFEDGVKMLTKYFGVNQIDFVKYSHSHRGQMINYKNVVEG